MKKHYILLFCLFFILNNLFSGGYQVRLQHQKHNGIGLIGSPFVWGSSSIFYNPGALAMYKGKMDISAGISPIFPYVAFQEKNTLQVSHNNYMPGFPVYLYFSAKISPKITAGIGVYTPYGSALQYDSHWVGKNVIQSISLMAYYIQPTISYRVNSKLGIGAGVIYAIGVFDIDRGLNYSRNASVNLNGSTSNIGFNIGVWYKPSHQVSLGLNYRSEIVMDLDDGKASFDLPSSLYNLIPQNNTFKSSIPLPANLDIGIAYQLNEKWLLAFELNWVQWSAYQSLNFAFEESGALLNQIMPRKYKDVITPRLGAEYAVRNNIKVRAGIYYDQSPINSNYFSPETVSLSAIGATIGISYSPIPNLDIDFSFGQSFSIKSEKNYEPANFKGTYKTNISAPGIGISYRFL